MNKQSIDRSGFGTVEIIVACLVVAVIGATGIILVNHHKKHVASSTAPATTQTTLSPDGTTTQPQQTAPAYLVIKEWVCSSP